VLDVTVIAHVRRCMQKRGHAIMASRRETRAVAFGRTCTQASA